MKKIAISIITFYQKFISAALINSCRFYPSCSVYTKKAIEKYGVMAGSLKGLKRILKCAPWSQGGVDLP